MRTFDSLAEGRGNNLDFLRLLLAVLVIYSHSFFLLPGAWGARYQNELLSLLTRGQTYGGEIAVNGFFAISGFLITQSWLRSRGLWDYLKKRVLRIYPGFVVACLASALIAGPLGAASARVYFEQFSAGRFAADVLLLRYITLPTTLETNPKPYEVNGSLWTIQPEFHCYLLVAGLGVLALYRRRGVVLALTLVCVAGWGLLNAIVGGPDRVPKNLYYQHHLLRLYTHFLAGMVFYLYRDRIPYGRGPALAALGALVVTAAGGGWQIVAPIAGVYVLMFVAFNPKVRLQPFGGRADLSYGVYLYAWPVQQLLIFFYPGVFRPNSLFAAATLVTCLLAVLSWYFVEKPCLKLKTKATPLAEGSAAPVALYGGKVR